MSAVDEDRPDELTEHYRAAAATDPARPSEAVRQSILAHARALAAGPVARHPTIARSGRPAAGDFRWRLSAAASVIVAGFAAILAWHAHTPPATSVTQETTAAPASPPEPFPLDRPATEPRAAEHSATVPRPRALASAEVARPAPEAPADLSREGEGAAGSRQAPAALSGANLANSTAVPGNAEERSMRARSAAASPPPAVAQLRSPGAADIAGSPVAKQAAHTIDWAALGPGFPIPASMPTASSDDPREAGFAPEWARRALKGVEAVAAPPQRQRAGAGASAENMALAIMSRKRAPEDEWAYEVERRLREVIRAEVDTQGPTVSRVFCNDVGCLCYTERDGENANAAGFGAISETLGRGSGWSRELGIDPRSVYLFATGAPGDLPTQAVWQLVFIMRSVQPQN
jgi:Meckel syndrome type 1 protein